MKVECPSPAWSWQKGASPTRKQSCCYFRFLHLLELCLWGQGQQGKATSLPAPKGKSSLDRFCPWSPLSTRRHHQGGARLHPLNDKSLLQTWLLLFCFQFADVTLMTFHTLLKRRVSELTGKTAHALLSPPELPLGSLIPLLGVARVSSSRLMTASTKFFFFFCTLIFLALSKLKDT